VSDGREKLLLIGGVPPDYARQWGITDDLALVEERLGVEITVEAPERAVELYRAQGEREKRWAAQRAERLLAGAAQPDHRPAPRPEAMTRAFRLYLALRHLADYHNGRHEGPTLHSAVPAGLEVTVARVLPRLEGLVSATGRARECIDAPRACRNTLVVDGPSPRAMPGHFRALQQHLVVGAGDVSAPLEEAAGRAGLPLLRA